MCTTVAKLELDAQSCTVMSSAQHEIRYQEHLNHCDLDHLCWAAAQPQITHSLLLLVLSAGMNIFGLPWCDVVSCINLFLSVLSFWRYYVHLIPNIRSKSLTWMPGKSAGERPSLPPGQQSCSWAVWQTLRQRWHLTGGRTEESVPSWVHRKGVNSGSAFVRERKNRLHYLQHTFMVSQEGLKCLEGARRFIPWSGKCGVSSAWHLELSTCVSKLSKLSAFLWSSKRWTGVR